MFKFFIKGFNSFKASNEAMVDLLRAMHGDLKENRNILKEQLKCLKAIKSEPGEVKTFTILI